MMRTIRTLVVIAAVLGLVIYLLRTMIATDPKALARLIDRADKLVVLGDLEKSNVVFESTDRKDLDALKAAVSVRVPINAPHCACYGRERIVLYAKGVELGWVSNQHCKNIRFSAWPSDAELLDPEAFITWFDLRKISGPRTYFENEKAREKEERESQAKWVAAMPTSLRTYWPQMRQSFAVKAQRLREALAAEIPDQKTRILALCSWYGSGSGPWSGYPMYEDVPEEMLLEYSSPDLLAAVNHDTLTGTQLAGAARFFAGPSFSKTRPMDLTSLPADLKARLLKHSLASNDDDKCQRAKKAFAEK